MKIDIDHIFQKGLLLEDVNYWMETCAHNKDALLAFWDVALDKTIKNNWRALWVVEHAIDKNRDNLELIFPKLFDLLLESNDNSILRIGLKLSYMKPLPNNDKTGRLLNKCEELLLNTKTPIATRANSLQFIFEFCKIEPDFINELEALMEHIAEHETSGGMTARIRNIHKAIKKL